MPSQSALNCASDEDKCRASIKEVVKDSHYAVGMFLQMQTKIVDKDETLKDMGLQLIDVYINYIKNMKYLCKLLLEHMKPLLSSQEFSSYGSIFKEDIETQVDDTQLVNCADETKPDSSKAINNDALSIFCEKTGLFVNSDDGYQNNCAENDVNSEKSFIIDLNEENNADFERSVSDPTEKLQETLITNNDDFEKHDIHENDGGENNTTEIRNDDYIKEEYLNDTFILDIKEEFRGDDILMPEENVQIQNDINSIKDLEKDLNFLKSKTDCEERNHEVDQSDNKTDDEDLLTKDKNEKNTSENDDERCLNFLYNKNYNFSSSDESSLGDISDEADDLELELNLSKKRKSLKLKRAELSDSDVSDVCVKSNKKARVLLDSDLDSSDNENTLSPKSPRIPTPEHLDGNISDELNNLLFGDSDDTDSENDNKNEDKNKNNKQKNTNTVTEKNDSAKKNEEDAEKNNWRNDPLLRQNLSPKSCTTKPDQNNKFEDELKIVENYPKPETSKNIASTSSLAIENELLMEVSSSEDSDIEFVNIQKKGPILVNNSDSEEERDKIKKTGRRNIRAVLEDQHLEVASQRATLEEAERIKRLTNKNKNNSNIDEGELILDFEPESDYKIVVNRNLVEKLKKHQIEGVKFMWNNCYESIKLLKSSPGTGCILAHTMGLGKTLQAITLVHTLFKYKVTNTKCVLIVCPLSTVLNWVNEFNIALSLTEDKNLNLYYDGYKKNLPKQALVKNWYADKRSVLIIGYEAFEKLTKDENDIATRNALLEGPDLVICDEGHLLKNMKTLRTKSLMRIKTKRRIVLTGTPLQNNLREYYYMVQFVKPNLLGSYKEYSNRFVNPIMNGQYHDSTNEDIFLMKQRSHVLHKLLKNTVHRYEVSELESYLPNKLDYVLFIQLTAVQRDLYKYYFETFCVNESVKRRLFNHQYILQLICFHPYLLEMKMKDCLKKYANNPAKIQIEFQEKWWDKIVDHEHLQEISYGPKLAVIFSIIEECEKVDDKVLIFSTNILELNIVEDYLKKIGTRGCCQWRKNFDYFRIDGTLTAARRNDICNLFNNKNNKQARVFLVSLKVGSLGLNLVAANRVILMDVSWNPASDSQSIFRTYRFGQSKECIIYRLVAMGTMEEVIYERSITKLAVASRVVDEKQISRHFRSQDIQDMFRCRIHPEEDRPTLKVPEDKILANIILKHTAVFQYHEHQALLENRPDEELNTQELERAWDEFNKEKLKQLTAAQTPQTTPQTRPQPQQNQATRTKNNLVLRSAKMYGQQRSPIIKLVNNTIGLSGFSVKVGQSKVGQPQVNPVESNPLQMMNGQNFEWTSTFNQTVNASIPINVSVPHMPTTSVVPNNIFNLTDDKMMQNGGMSSSFTEEHPLLVATKWVPIEEDKHFMQQ